MREQDLQNSILEYLSYRPGTYWRINSGMIPATYKGKKRMIKLAPKGFADIIGITNKGQFVAIEVKVGKNKPTPAQTEFLETINKSGGLSFVAYSVDDVKEKL